MRGGRGVWVRSWNTVPKIEPSFLVKTPLANEALSPWAILSPIPQGHHVIARVTSPNTSGQSEEDLALTSPRALLPCLPVFSVVAPKFLTKASADYYQHYHYWLLLSALHLRAQCTSSCSSSPDHHLSTTWNGIHCYHYYSCRLTTPATIPISNSSTPINRHKHSSVKPHRLSTSFYANRRRIDELPRPQDSPYHRNSFHKNTNAPRH